MKCKYCLIRCEGELDVSSVVYVVWVGSSLRESCLLPLVEEFCKDCGWYFKRWSTTVDSALELRTKMSRVDGNRTATPYRMQSVSLETIYQTIIDDSWASLERSFVMTPQEKFMRFRNDPHFIMAMNSSKRITPCSPSKSKYLSLRKRCERHPLATAVAGIVLIILADTIVSTQIISNLF